MALQISGYDHAYFKKQPISLPKLTPYVLTQIIALKMKALEVSLLSSNSLIANIDTLITSTSVLPASLMYQTSF